MHLVHRVHRVPLVHLVPLVHRVHLVPARLPVVPVLGAPVVRPTKLCGHKPPQPATRTALARP